MYESYSKKTTAIVYALKNILIPCVKVSHMNEVSPIKIILLKTFVLVKRNIALFSLLPIYFYYINN